VGRKKIIFGGFAPYPPGLNWFSKKDQGKARGAAGGISYQGWAPYKGEKHYFLKRGKLDKGGGCGTGRKSRSGRNIEGKELRRNPLEGTP